MLDRARPVLTLKAGFSYNGGYKNGTKMAHLHANGSHLSARVYRGVRVIWAMWVLCEAGGRQ
jgi:hypothetical protein